MKENAIGVLGGTFDPVHNAHLEIARAAMRELSLDRLVFIPTGAPRYRKPAIASGAHRVAMLELAIAGEPGFAIDARELADDATGYTVDTLQQLRRELERDTTLYLVIGADQHASFPTWYRPDEVRRLSKIAVVARPGIPVKDDGAAIIPMAPMSISASDIRARAARGEDLAGLVPSAVANYIHANRLYR
jgi:nicotinate-nucleotide adenylyltransferase